MKKFNVNYLRKRYTKRKAICYIIILVILTIFIFSMMEYFLLNTFNENDFVSNFIIVNIIEKMLFIISILVVITIIFFYEKQKKYCDYLTKLFLIEKMYIDIKKCILKLDTFSVAYIDLDNFSEINSNYGHLKANNILINFAANAMKLSSDISWYRVGGDEFLAIIGEGENDLKTNIDKLHTLTKQKIVIDNCTKEEIELFISIGIVNYPIDDKNYECLISLADKRMYDNKKNKKEIY